MHFLRPEKKTVQNDFFGYRGGCIEGIAAPGEIGVVVVFVDQIVFSVT
jgi:hypothetical protein